MQKEQEVVGLVSMYFYILKSTSDCLEIRNKIKKRIGEEMELKKNQ